MAQLKGWQRYFPNECVWPPWRTADTAHGCSKPASCLPGFSQGHLQLSVLNMHVLWPLRFWGRMAPELATTKSTK